MMAVSIGDAAEESRGHHQRPVHADHAHCVIKDAVVTPLLQCFFHGLRKTVITDPAKVLRNATAAIPRIRVQQFIGARQAERLIALAGHGILAALAARQRHHRGAGPDSARFIGEHAAVFIVGMRDDGHHARPGMQFLQRLPQRRRAAILRERLAGIRGERKMADAGHRNCRRRCLRGHGRGEKHGE
jgi:hypothetical protein